MIIGGEPAATEYYSAEGPGTDVAASSLSCTSRRLLQTSARATWTICVFAAVHNGRAILTTAKLSGRAAYM